MGASIYTTSAKKRVKTCKKKGDQVSAKFRKVEKPDTNLVNHGDQFYDQVSKHIITGTSPEYINGTPQTYKIDSPI